MLVLTGEGQNQWVQSRWYCLSHAGLKGEKALIGARILAVADAFDAMAADRPYRKGPSSEEAMQQLIETGGEQFDVEVVEVFKTCYQT